MKIAKRDYETPQRVLYVNIGRIQPAEGRGDRSKGGAFKDRDRYGTKRLELLEKEKLLEQVQIKFQGLEREIAEIEKNIAVAKTEIENQQEYLSRLFQQKEEYNAKETEAIAKRQELEKTEADLLSELGEQEGTTQRKGGFLKVPGGRTVRA